MNSNIPYFAIGNEELAQKQAVGTHVVCKHCGKRHKVKYGTSKTLKHDGTYTEPVKSDMGFTNCGKKTFLVSIGGREL